MRYRNQIIPQFIKQAAGDTGTGYWLRLAGAGPNRRLAEVIPVEDHTSAVQQVLLPNITPEDLQQVSREARAQGKKPDSSILKFVLDNGWVRARNWLSFFSIDAGNMQDAIQGLALALTDERCGVVRPREIPVQLGIVGKGTVKSQNFEALIEEIEAHEKGIGGLVPPKAKQLLAASVVLEAGGLSEVMKGIDRGWVGKYLFNMGSE